MRDSVVVKGLNKNFVIRVRFSRRFRARMWIAKRLIQAAAWVMGCGVHIEESEDEHAS